MDGKDDEVERRKWLDEVPGWSWHPHEDAWVTFKVELLKYVESNDTAAVAATFVSASMYPLGVTVNNVRHGTFLKNVDGVERRKWLGSLPGWKWATMNERLSVSSDVAWETFQSEMLKHVKARGTANVAAAYVSSSGYTLGSSVHSVRRKVIFLKNDHLGERKRWIDALPGWTWAPLDDAWETLKSEIARHVALNGTSHVSASYVSTSGYKLYRILINVRSKGAHWKGKRDEVERVAWLESLPGWRWTKGKEPASSKFKVQSAAAASSGTAPPARPDSPSYSD